jgi:alkylation response protein AidB-like acyl-CoA dehydrogenase
MAYQAPLKEMRFLLHELADLAAVAALPGCDGATADTVDAILEEAGKFATEVLDPLNQPGDQQGARWHDGVVSTADGFKAAYTQFAAAGWNALGAHEEHGGQGLPALVATPVAEMWNGANLAFALCPMLTQGAIDALVLRGSPRLQELFLPKMVSGEWTGTMNLTEPQAGSDLAAVRTRAVPEADHYRLYGQKIFITYGEHDYTENIIHLVLARTPDAPTGVKGISLFVVPKVLVNADGSLGARNDVRCVSIEHKLGIHASPTAVLAYGDKEGAIGYLVGEENRGLEYMFIMMNAARFNVGLEGVAIADRAYQRAVTYARERVQGRAVGDTAPGGSIIRHPDVRRMLLLMRAQTEGVRALAYVTAAQLDIANRHPDAGARQRAQAIVDLLIPVVKGHSTEIGVAVSSLGVQVHGGMGYIEETGAAQHLRDARITTIYEGTTGIQANDLVGRKIARDGGAAAKAVIAAIRGDVSKLGGDPSLAVIGSALENGAADMERALDAVLANLKGNPRAAFAGAVPLLHLFGVVCCGWQLALSAAIAAKKLTEPNADVDFLRAKGVTARFYADHVMCQSDAYAHSVVTAAATIDALADAAF